jgi:hypothetical protein
MPLQRKTLDRNALVSGCQLTKDSAIEPKEQT